jgi:hypothetical protein
MASDHSVPRRLTGSLLVVVFTVAAVRLAIVLNLPLLFLPKAGHDDGLFMRLGASLASGHWLGDFSQFTLMKGPGYPAFLAVTNFSGLSVDGGLPLKRPRGIEVAPARATRPQARRPTMDRVGHPSPSPPVL